MAWADLRDMLQRVVSRGAGILDSQVVWAYQDVSEPGEPFIVLSLGGARSVGIPYVKTQTDLTRPQGQEIRMRVQGVREVSLELQAFTKYTNPGDQGQEDALDLAGRAQLALCLPTNLALLKSVGIGIFDDGSVHYLPEVVSVNFRGRATCSMRAYVTPQIVEEYAGYIARVSGQVTSTGGKNPTPDVRNFQAPKP